MKADKINMVINLSILALLIYLAVAVKSLQKEVFWNPNITKPMMMKSNDMNLEMRYNIQELVNNILREAINQTGEQ
jgi:hypothetical protein